MNRRAMNRRSKPPTTSIEHQAGVLYAFLLLLLLVSVPQRLLLNTDRSIASATPADRVEAERASSPHEEVEAGDRRRMRGDADEPLGDGSHGDGNGRLHGQPGADAGSSASVGAALGGSSSRRLADLTPSTGWGASVPSGSTPAGTLPGTMADRPGPPIAGGRLAQPTACSPAAAATARKRHAPTSNNVPRTPSAGGQRAAPRKGPVRAANTCM
jgi:hypothetical protein